MPRFFHGFYFLLYSSPIVELNSFIVGLIFEIHIKSCLIGFYHRSLIYLGHQHGKGKDVLEEGKHISRDRETERDCLTSDQRIQWTVLFGNN